LIAVLRPLVPEVLHADEYAGVTLERWLDMIGRITSLLDVLGRPVGDGPLLLDKDTRVLLGEARLDAPVQKTRCGHVAQRIRHVLAAEISAGRLTVKADLTNNTGLVEVFTADYPRSGCQLQGEDFRLAFETNPAHVPASEADLWPFVEQRARCHDGFFDFTAVAERIPGAGEPRPPLVSGRPMGFRHFKPSFVDRYVPVPGITAKQAKVLAAQYARRALAERERAA
jgi:hypothetical protein